MLWGKKRNLFLQLFEVVKRFQMLEGKGESVGRVERRWSKVEIKALHHVILKFIILVISPHCSYQLQCNWSWQRAAVDIMCHPRVVWRGGNFGKGNWKALLQKCSEMFIGQSKWTSATAGLSESIYVFSLSHLGGKVPKRSLTTFQTVAKQPGLANLRARFQSACFSLSVWFLVLWEFS